MSGDTALKALAHTLLIDITYAALPRCLDSSGFLLLSVDAVHTMNKIADKRKRFGWRAACHTLAYKLVQRCIVLDITHLMVLDLCDLPSEHQNKADFHTLSHGEVSMFARNADLDLDPTIADRLHGDKDVCFAVMVAGELAGYYWLAFDSIEAIHNSAGTEETGVAMSYPTDRVFGYNAFVRPEYRGHGLYAQLVLAAARWAHEQKGIRFLVSTVDWTNYAAMRSCQRLGRRSLGLIWRFGIRGKMFTVGPPAAGRHGIQLSDKAIVTKRLACGALEIAV